ncbi:MAG: carbamoyltransferase HypF [Pirellulales bacterium]
MRLDATVIRRRVTISGVVQGVGFRPFVWRRATRLGLSGWVENDAAGVVLEVQGPSAAVAAFLENLDEAAPPLAAVGRIDVHAAPVRHEQSAVFAILASVASGRRSAHVPPDIAPCPACLAELADPGDRRHRYPFVNCTDCGPRFTIIEGLPYDRTATTMARFAMCPRCAAEYADPADRRFHAEPTACPACGPVAWFADASDTPVPTERRQARCSGEAAIAAARDLLGRGAILAIKGVGGFHLACDATNATAVGVLRTRKHRAGKPFAVLVHDTATARRLAVVDEQERRLLEGRDRPVVLLRQPSHETASDQHLAEAVAPGLDVVGIMLPSSPLHHLICEGMPPLVMTSGNLAEEPIATDNDDAVRRLTPLVDGFLFHDRPIHVACDDSVVRCVAGALLPIRRSRGHAPAPVRLASSGPSVLAVGGELKAALCVARGDMAFLSQHVGDVGNVETLQALDDTAHHLLRLFDTTPAAVVADLHPAYLSADWAARFAATLGIPCLRVQHHEAHVAALLAEHGFDLAAAPTGFIGCCFDGTGFGPDGTIRGGEFLVIDAGRFTRAAHLRPFPLPGGDAAIRHPWRSALAILHAAGMEWHRDLAPVAARDTEEAVVIRRQLERGIACIPTTSMGRLFDAAAAMLGVTESVTYEAEAAMKLEAAAATAERAFAIAAYAISAAAAHGPLVIDWHGPIAAVVDAARRGTDVPGAAAGFHASTAAMIVDTCRMLRDRGAGSRVGLTGGVFQNALLLEQTLDGLHAAGFEALTHHAVPPNDGGLALGQAVLARHQIRSMMP